MSRTRASQEARGGAGDVRPVPASGGSHTGHPGRSWSIVIDDWLPPSLNRLLGSHWAKRARLKRSVMTIVGLARFRSPIWVPSAEGRRRVTLILTVVNRSHAPDPDNVPKALLDSLVKLGLLVDDCQEHCELGPVRIERGERKRTTLILEDIDV